MSSSNEFKSDFIGNFVFFFLRLAHWIQAAIATIFWGIFVLPALYFSKLLNAERSVPEEERRTQGNSFVVLDLLKLHHKLFWKYLRSAFWCNSKLNGMLSRYAYFRKLMNWNSAIPLMGFVDDKTTFTFELLFGHSERREGRYCDLTWLSKDKFHGTFQILSKDIREEGGQEKLFIKCIWTSGEDVGTIFEIAKHVNLESEQVVPNTVFYPPRPIIFAFEALISASAVLAFFQLTKDGWGAVSDWLINLWAFLIEFFVGLKELLIWMMS